MENKKILWLTGLAILALGIFIFWANQNTINTTTPQKVRIAYLPVVQSLPLFMAIEKGYFKEAGLEAEIIKFEAPNQIIDALLSGQADIGAPGTASGITAISQDKKPDSLKIFALIGGDQNTTNDELLVKIDSSIKTIADLKNKKLGILPGIQFRTIAKDILTKNSLNIDLDVQIVELAVPLQLQALASNQVDALLTIEPIGTIGASKNITKELIHAPMVQHISNPWYGAVGNITTDFLKTQPKTAEKILSVFNKTISEINEKPNEARMYLKNYTSLDDELVKAVPLPIFKYYTDFTANDITALQKFFDIFQANKVIEKQIVASQLLYK
jgi:NitT/TauT family transport system substrate-binding protein